MESSIFWQHYKHCCHPMTSHLIITCVDIHDVTFMYGVHNDVTHLMLMIVYPVPDDLTLDSVGNEVTNLMLV